MRSALLWKEIYMGLALEFLPGDEQAIVAAMETFDLDRLDEDEVVRPSLTVAVDSEDGGAFLIAREWIEYSPRFPNRGWMKLSLTGSKQASGWPCDAAVCNQRSRLAFRRSPQAKRYWESA